MSARQSTRAAGVAVLAVLALVLLAVVPGYAAGMTMAGGKARGYTTAAARCTNAALTVSPSGTASSSGQYTSLTVSGLTGTCTTGRVVLYRAASPSTILFNGAGTVSGATMASTSTAFTPPTSADGAVYVLMNGWRIAATWSFAPPTVSGPVSPGNTPTVMTDITWTLVTNNPVQTCFVSHVTTSSTDPAGVEWRLTLDLSKAPFNGQATGYQITGADSWRYTIYDATPSAGYLQIGGTDSGGRKKVTAAQSYEIGVCNWSLPPGVQTPSAYSVQVTRGTPWTSTQACYDVRIIGNGSSQFYFGWQFDLDMSAAVALIPHFTHWSNPTNNLSQVAWTGTTANAFHAVSNSSANLVGTSQFLLTYCANGY